jgi:hypothetical protein
MKLMNKIISFDAGSQTGFPDASIMGWSPELPPSQGYAHEDLFEEILVQVKILINFVMQSALY